MRIANEMGRTPIDAAREKGHGECVAAGAGGEARTEKTCDRHVCPVLKLMESRLLYYTYLMSSLLPCHNNRPRVRLPPGQGPGLHDATLSLSHAAPCVPEASKQDPPAFFAQRGKDGKALPDAGTWRSVKEQVVTHVLGR